MTSYEDLGLFAFGLPGKVIFFFLAVFKILKGSFSLPFPVRKDKYIWEEEIKGIKGNKVKKRTDGSRKRKKKSL